MLSRPAAAVAAAAAAGGAVSSVAPACARLPLGDPFAISHEGKTAVTAAATAAAAAAPSCETAAAAAAVATTAKATEATATPEEARGTTSRCSWLYAVCLAADSAAAAAAGEQLQRDSSHWLLRVFGIIYCSSFLILILKNKK